MRAGLCKGLGFSPQGREENIRRTAEVAKLMADSGQVVLCSLISPKKEFRDNARKIVMSGNLPFFEVFVNTSIDECKRRDTKGLYKKKDNGELPFGLTGIDDPYDEPTNPELNLRTEGKTIEETVCCVLQLLKENVSEYDFKLSMEIQISRHFSNFYCS